MTEGNRPPERKPEVGSTRPQDESSSVDNGSTNLQLKKSSWTSVGNKREGITEEDGVKQRQNRNNKKKQKYRRKNRRNHKKNEAMEQERKEPNVKEEASNELRDSNGLGSYEVRDSNKLQLQQAAYGDINEPYIERDRQNLLGRADDAKKEAVETFQSSTKFGAQNVQRSPRKEAIKRYQNIEKKLSEHSLSEAKDNLKNLHKYQVSSQVDRLELSPKSYQKCLVSQERKSIFKYPSARIILYEEQLKDSLNKIMPVSGRLLGHGAIEIFQLHDCDVTYLSCGSSLVYPLLPKLKILRIAFDTFILPLVNPERYWKILIDCDQAKVLMKLEQAFSRCVKYRNLYFLSTMPSTQVDHEEPKSPKENTEIDSEPIELKDAQAWTSDPGKLVTVSKETNSKEEENHLPIIFDEIPESPPSVPVSPNASEPNISPLNLHAAFKDKPQNYEKGLLKKHSNKSIATATACLDSKDPEPTELDAFQGKNHHSLKNLNSSIDAFYRLSLGNQKAHGLDDNRKQLRKLKDYNMVNDKKSDSSMDSLLDEYEENISMTKSNTINKSQTASRRVSMVSYFPQLIANHRAQAYNEDHELESSHYNEPFPSVPDYGHGYSGNIRSRQSSRSELYTVESNWMEPGFSATNRVRNRTPSTRLTQHGASQSSQDLKQIYRSITQRSLASILQGNEDNTQGLAKNRIPPRSYANTGRNSAQSQRLSHKASFSSSIRGSHTGSVISLRNQGAQNSPFPKQNLQYLNTRKTRPAGLQLDSSKIYSVLHSNSHDKAVPSKNSRDKKSETSKFASRFFGW